MRRSIQDSFEAQITMAIFVRIRRQINDASNKFKVGFHFIVVEISSFDYYKKNCMSRTEPNPRKFSKKWSRKS